MNEHTVTKSGPFTRSVNIFEFLLSFQTFLCYFGSPKRVQLVTSLLYKLLNQLLPNSIDNVDSNEV